MQILASETAREAADALGAILGGTRNMRPSETFFRTDHCRVWQAIADGGWTALGMPEEQGGAGLGLIDLAMVAEAWGRHLMPLPYLPTMLIRRWAQRQGNVPLDIAGNMLTYGLPGFDPAGMKPKALSPFLGLPGVRYVTGLGSGGEIELAPMPLTEAAGFVSSASHKEHGKPRADHAPSLPLGQAPLATTGLGETARQEIAVLGAAELIGCGLALLDITIDYARERRQFGQAIAEYQAIQHRLANMHRDIEVARTAVNLAVNEPEKLLGSVRVAWDRIRAVTENGFQIHGGFGFTWDAGVHYYSRHVWAMGHLLRACGVHLWPN